MTMNINHTSPYLIDDIIWKNADLILPSSYVVNIPNSLALADGDFEDDDEEWDRVIFELLEAQFGCPVVEIGSYEPADDAPERISIWLTDAPGSAQH